MNRIGKPPPYLTDNYRRSSRRNFFRMIESMRMEYFEDESFFFFGRTKISSIFATAFRRSSNNAEAAQLVEHSLASKDNKVTTLARRMQNRQTANAKEYNAEVAQLVEHKLAPKRLKVPTLARRMQNRTDYECKRIQRGSNSVYGLRKSKRR